MESYLPQYTQLFGIGLLWVTFHCAGMCGPIVAGVVSTCPSRVNSVGRVLENTGRVLAYQTGRLLTYAALGALAGWLGAVAEEAVSGWTKVAGTALAAGLVGFGIYEIARLAGGRPTSSNASGTMGGEFLGRWLRRINRHLPRQHTLRMMAFGFLFGFLPCMLMFWVLGLAASTASMLHGSLIMAGLVAMTTPILVFSAAAAGLVRPLFSRLGPYFAPAAMILSGSWMGLMAAAANGWIDHMHLGIRLFGESYMVMLW